ncbi:BZ3500_MvSof-1268-A1-R1_C049g00184 [Microbotryum saponariae]|uniref:BZ3500_MvSof-1268-A1-R1_C049g00184 protein n=1 Tax=Microbotryum saponariae TaxID=289078 RepID=A0A2X0KME7_9BASI|nr:BZ3500_MvSof-1268-A1-R1_C049g00184 [Microbotryum saponariae]
MPVSTAQKWPAANSRWNSIEDLSLLFHLSLLEANLSPSFTSTSRPGENGQLPSISIMANIPGCKHVVLAQVGQPSPQEWVVDRVHFSEPPPLQPPQVEGKPQESPSPRSQGEPADLETYLNRGYIDVGSELLGPTDLTRLEGSLRSCARREGRFLRASNFKCLPHRRLELNGGVLVFAQRTRAELSTRPSSPSWTGR